MRNASRPYLAYVILLLFLVNAANYGQRMIISIILPAIKAEIALTDAQLGILMGGGFALFFAVAGVPLARLADRSVRRTFLAGAILFWSSATALFGATSTFAQMLTARVALGVGESACIPTSHSLLTDYVSPDNRPLAFGIHSTGGVVGVTLALMLGGYLATAIGWRNTMYLAAIPGFLLALLVFFTLREPARHGASASAPEVRHFPLKAVVQHLLVDEVLSLRPAGDLLQPAGRVRPEPVAAVLLRAPVRPRDGGRRLLLRPRDRERRHPGQHHRRAGRQSPRALGRPLARLVAGDDVRHRAAGGAVDAARDHRPQQALMLNALYAFVIFATNGAFWAACFISVPPMMRATTSAITLMVGGIFGVAVGPVLVGLISDFLAPRAGSHSLQSSLVAVECLAIVVVVFLLIAARHLRKEQLNPAGSSLAVAAS